MNQNNSNLNWERLLLIISLRDINVNLTSLKGTIKVQHLIKDLQLYRIYLQAAAIESWWLRLIILSESLKFGYVLITAIIHA